MVARQPIESRKLLLENTFPIKEEFFNNEATSWVVRVLKNRGLKRLFKPVASRSVSNIVYLMFWLVWCFSVLQVVKLHLGLIL
jgi:hypothetical protein